MTTRISLDRADAAGGAAGGASPSSPPGESDVPVTSLLPEPPACGLADSAIVQIAMFLTRADEQDRRDARGTAQAADQAALQEANDRVQQMMDKADADRSGGLWQGVADVAGGTCVAIGAFCPARGAKVLSGFGAGLDGVGKFESGAFKADADCADALAAKDQALAEAAAHHYDEAHGDAQAADESIQKVQQFLQSTLEAENAARLAAVGGRA